MLTPWGQRPSSKRKDLMKASYPPWIESKIRHKGTKRALERHALVVNAREVGKTEKSLSPWVSSKSCTFHCQNSVLTVIFFENYKCGATSTRMSLWSLKTIDLQFWLGPLWQSLHSNWTQPSKLAWFLWQDTWRTKWLKHSAAALVAGGAVLVHLAEISLDAPYMSHVDVYTHVQSTGSEAAAYFLPSNVSRSWESL